MSGFRFLVGGEIHLYGSGTLDRVEECMNGSEVEIPFSYTSPREVYSGRKTATRRIQRYRAEVGMRMRAVFPSYSIVDLHITAVYGQKLGDMSEDDAKREGYQSLDSFKKAWAQTQTQGAWDPEQNVWVIEWKKPN